MEFNLIYYNGGRFDEKIALKLKRAFELGYKTVAVNTIVDSSVLDEKTADVPEPRKLMLNSTDTAYFGRKLTILHRLTAIITETIQAHRLMQSPNTKKYDILAIQPVGEKMLQHACSTLDIEIISIDLTEKLGYSLKRTYLNQAKERGISFEIQYGPCFRDETARCWVISNAQILIQVLKGKNIIFSSGAMKPLEVRRVHDVINLGHIFGLDSDSSASAVAENGLLVLSHSKTRLQTGCGFVSVEEIFKITHRDMWLAEATAAARKMYSDEESTSTTAANNEEPTSATVANEESTSATVVNEESTSATVANEESTSETVVNEESTSTAITNEESTSTTVADVESNNESDDGEPPSKAPKLVD